MGKIFPEAGKEEGTEGRNNDFVVLFPNDSLVEGIAWQPPIYDKFGHVYAQCWPTDLLAYLSYCFSLFVFYL